MILPDVNLLVYAHNEASRYHNQARSWWVELMQGSTPVGISWAVLTGFLRIVTHPGIQSAPLGIEEALSITDSWIDQPMVHWLEPGRRHYQILSSLLRSMGTGGNLITDAHLAALAIEHQAELHSNDADFARFPGLRWINPLTRG